MTVTRIGENTADDHSGSASTRIRESDATTNYNSITTISIYKKNAVSQTWHSLLHFTGLSNIDSGETVSAATLSLWRKDGYSSPTYTITFRRLLRDFVDSEATYTIWKTSNSWTTLGGLSDGNDRVGAGAVSPAWNGTTGEYKTISASELVTDVQEWIDLTNTNNGWHAEQTDAGLGDVEWSDFSSDNDTDGQRPTLSVTHAPGGVKIPVSMHHHLHHNLT